VTKNKLGNLFLIGYRGTGKTTTARLLAQRLGWPWLDADVVLEERHGRTIAQIFAQEGEAGFRDKEETVLADLARGGPSVIATGGGVVLRGANRACLRASGRVVWLTAAPRTIHDRLRRDATASARRPPLTVGGLPEIEELLRVREPLYRDCTDWTIDTTQCSPEEVVQLICHQLEGKRQEPNREPSLDHR
jgi:shikimate kinase